MSKSIVILIAIVAIAVGVFIGRYALGPAQQPQAANTGQTHDQGAADAASRAMTFTQPKAPAQ